MTYNVFGVTLSLTQSINQSIVALVQQIKFNTELSASLSPKLQNKTKCDVGFLVGRAEALEPW